MNHGAKWRVCLSNSTTCTHVVSPMGATPSKMEDSALSDIVNRHEVTPNAKVKNYDTGACRPYLCTGRAHGKQVRN